MLVLDTVNCVGKDAGDSIMLACTAQAGLARRDLGHTHI